MQTFIAPTRILWQQGVTNAARLLKPGDQAVVHDPDACTLAHAGTAPGVLLDFGRELHGALQLITTCFSPNNPVCVRVCFGESASEAMGEPNQDHAVHRQETLVPWCGSVLVGPTGFRFARVDVIDPGATLTLVGIRAQVIESTSRRTGSFTCSDPRINAVWETAARTVELCMQDYLWDGIKRDRLVWMGDLHPEVMVVAGLHGNHPVVPRSLDFMRDSTPFDQWMNGISSYSLWWIRTHFDWFMRTADRAYLAQQQPYLTALLGRIANMVKTDGSHEFPNGLIDWATAYDQESTTAGTHALLAWTLQAGGALATEMGDHALAKLALTAAERLAHRGQPASATKQATALAVLAGLRNPAAANRTVFTHNPCAGLSTFYGYYVLEARARAGDVAGGLDLLRSYWGAMLDLGATSFWEHFDLAWLDGAKPSRMDELPGDLRDLHRTTGDHCYVGLRHSLCHGWAGGPAIWALDHVLGVVPASPGFSTVRITPDLGGLAWAEGIVPTPHGPISIRLAQGKDSQITLPAGVTRVP